MKKTLLLSLFLIAGTIVLRSQTFQFTPNHTTVTDTLGSELIFEFELKNISNSPQTVYIVRPVEVLPHPDWTSSLCFDQGCFAPFVDSVATTVDFGSSPIQPGESREFSVHIFTMTQEGSATVVVEAHNLANPSESYSHTLTGRTSPVSVENEAVPAEFSLGQNHPNPFNPSTVISYSLPAGGNVDITVYNSLGEKVITLVEGVQEAGNHQVSFNASGLGSGVYFYRLVSANFTSTKKMLLAK